MQLGRDPRLNNPVDGRILLNRAAEVKNLFNESTERALVSAVEHAADSGDPSYWSKPISKTDRLSIINTIPGVWTERESQQGRDVFYVSTPTGESDYRHVAKVGSQGHINSIFHQEMYKLELIGFTAGILWVPQYVESDLRSRYHQKFRDKSVDPTGDEHLFNPAPISGTLNGSTSLETTLTGMASDIAESSIAQAGHFLGTIFDKSSKSVSGGLVKAHYEFMAYLCSHYNHFLVEKGVESCSSTVRDLAERLGKVVFPERMTATVMLYDLQLPHLRLFGTHPDLDVRSEELVVIDDGPPIHLLQRFIESSEPHRRLLLNTETNPIGRIVGRPETAMGIFYSDLKMNYKNLLTDAKESALAMASSISLGQPVGPYNPTPDECGVIKLGFDLGKTYMHILITLDQLERAERAAGRSLGK